MDKGPATRINTGDEIPGLIAGPVTIQDIVEWCGAEGDYLSMHYDPDAARAAGLPGCVIQGTYKYGLLGKMVTDWAGTGGVLKKIGVRYVGMDFPGDTLTCRGRVTARYAAADGHHVELEVWTENQRGERNTLGTASVTLGPLPT